MVGVELQQDVAALGNELTRRCSMRGEVSGLLEFVM